MYTHILYYIYIVYYTRFSLYLAWSLFPTVDDHTEWLFLSTSTRVTPWFVRAVFTNVGRTSGLILLLLLYYHIVIGFPDILPHRWHFILPYSWYYIPHRSASIHRQCSPCRFNVLMYYYIYIASMFIIMFNTVAISINIHAQFINEIFSYSSVIGHWWTI